MHMLWSESESDYPSGNPAEEWKQRQQPDCERRREPIPFGEDAPDDSILNHELQSLRHAGRPLTPLLDPLEVLGCQSLRTERRSQQIRRRDRILDSQVDPDTTDRRHGMRRIADAEETRTIPLAQPVDLNRQ